VQRQHNRTRRQASRKTSSKVNPTQSLGESDRPIFAGLILVTVVADTLRLVKAWDRRDVGRIDHD
jgi:hypothetical protein